MKKEEHELTPNMKVFFDKLLQIQKDLNHLNQRLTDLINEGE